MSRNLMRFFCVAVATTILLSGSVGLAGTILDYSGNSNDGTSYGDVVSVAGPVPQVEAFSFDGDGDYIVTPDLGNPLTAGTVAAWVKFDSGYMISGWGNGLFACKEWVDGAFRLETDGTQIRLPARPSGGGRSDIITSFAPTADQWYHLAYSFGVYLSESESITRLVVTDALGNATTYTGAAYDAAYTFSQSDIQFGGMAMATGSDRDSCLNGDMTDMRIYTEALSTADIALLADTDIMTSPSSANLLVHYYPVQVPEPSTLALLLGAMFAAWVIRKK